MLWGQLCSLRASKNPKFHGVFLFFRPTYGHLPARLYLSACYFWVDPNGHFLQPQSVYQVVWSNFCTLHPCLWDRSQNPHDQQLSPHPGFPLWYWLGLSHNSHSHISPGQGPQRGLSSFISAWYQWIKTSVNAFTAQQTSGFPSFGVSSPLSFHFNQGPSLPSSL